MFPAYILHIRNIVLPIRLYTYIFPARARMDFPGMVRRETKYQLHMPLLSWTVDPALNECRTFSPGLEPSV